MNDTIRRQDALDEIRRFSGYLDEDMITRIHIGLNRLPPAPQRTGHWIEDDNEMFVICSECGEKNDYISAFCPDCGAKMLKDGEG